MIKFYLYTVFGVIIGISFLTGACKNNTNKNATTRTVKDSLNKKLDRGSYLVNVACNCMHCHADRDFTKFSGPIVAGTEGKGGEEVSTGVYVKNITPSLLGSWTDDE